MRLPVTSHHLAFFVVLGVLAGLGFAIGRTIGLHPKLETFKLLNVAGLAYDLLGLLVLTEFVARSERVKAFVISWVAGTVLWSQSLAPLGAALGAWSVSPAASSAVAAKFFFSFWAYSLMVLAVLDSTVFYPRLSALQDPTERTRRFGFILLVSGVAVQLIAAFKDLYA